MRLFTGWAQLRVGSHSDHLCVSSKQRRECTQDALRTCQIHLVTTFTWTATGLLTCLHDTEQSRVMTTISFLNVFHSSACVVSQFHFKKKDCLLTWRPLAQSTETYFYTSQCFPDIETQLNWLHLKRGLPESHCGFWKKTAARGRGVERQSLMRMCLVKSSSKRNKIGIPGNCSFGLQAIVVLDFRQTFDRYISNQKRQQDLLCWQTPEWQLDFMFTPLLTCLPNRKTSQSYFSCSSATWSLGFTDWIVSEFC